MRLIFNEKNGDAGDPRRRSRRRVFRLKSDGFLKVLWHEINLRARGMDALASPSPPGGREKMETDFDPIRTLTRDKKS